MSAQGHKPHFGSQELDSEEKKKKLKKAAEDAVNVAIQQPDAGQLFFNTTKALFDAQQAFWQTFEVTAAVKPFDVSELVIHSSYLGQEQASAIVAKKVADIFPSSNADKTLSAARTYVNTVFADMEHLTKTFVIPSRATEVTKEQSEAFASQYYKALKQQHLSIAPVQRAMPTPQKKSWFQRAVSAVKGWFGAKPAKALSVELQYATLLPLPADAARMVKNAEDFYFNQQLNQPRVPQAPGVEERQAERMDQRSRSISNVSQATNDEGLGETASDKRLTQSNTAIIFASESLHFDTVSVDSATHNNDREAVHLKFLTELEGLDETLFDAGKMFEVNGSVDINDAEALYTGTVLEETHPAVQWAVDQLVPANQQIREELAQSLVYQDPQGFVLNNRLDERYPRLANHYLNSQFGRFSDELQSNIDNIMVSVQIQPEHARMLTDFALSLLTKDYVQIQGDLNNTKVRLSSVISSLDSKEVLNATELLVLLDEMEKIVNQIDKLPAAKSKKPDQKTNREKQLDRALRYLRDAGNQEPLSMKQSLLEACDALLAVVNCEPDLVQKALSKNEVLVNLMSSLSAKLSAFKTVLLAEQQQGKTTSGESIKFQQLQEDLRQFLSKVKNVTLNGTKVVEGKAAQKIVKLAKLSLVGYARIEVGGLIASMEFCEQSLAQLKAALTSKPVTAREVTITPMRDCRVSSSITTPQPLAVA